MSQPRFLADHDLREAIVGGVQARVRDDVFLRARDLNLRESPDEEVLEYAAQNQLLVVSHDKSTMTAAAYDRMRTGREMLGLFIIEQSDPIGPAIESLTLIALASEAEEWHSRVVYLPPL